MLGSICLALASTAIGICIMLREHRKMMNPRLFTTGADFGFKVGAGLFVAGFLGLAYIFAGPEPKF